MTDAEKDRLIDEAAELEIAGDSEGAKNLLRQIPVSPGLAIGMLDAVGPDVLLSTSLNFSDIEELLGPDWHTDGKKTERRALDKTLMDAKITGYEREFRPHQ